MTDLIEAVQKQDPGSELVSLFELNFGDTTLYFHPGLDNESNVYFEEPTGDFIIREYQPFPIEMTGVDYSADGATNRPTLTVANVTIFFSDALGGITNEDLIGETITVRQTLKTHLSDKTAFDATPPHGSLPIEFPKKKFIIDRVAGENALSVSFEVSSPYDLQGVKIPGRQVIGKYCSWIYQGAANELGGGCSWPADSIARFSGTTVTKEHKMYFTVTDEPIVTAAQKTAMELPANAPTFSSIKVYTVYATDDPIVADNYYEHPVNGKNTIWKALLPQTADSHVAAPQYKSVYWIRGDVCGKRLSSCKCRFQFVPYDSTNNHSYPKTDKNSNAPLPFGAFPGSKKFR